MLYVHQFHTCIRPRVQQWPLCNLWTILSKQCVSRSLVMFVRRQILDVHHYTEYEFKSYEIPCHWSRTTWMCSTRKWYLSHKCATVVEDAGWLSNSQGYLMFNILWTMTFWQQCYIYPPKPHIGCSSSVQENYPSLNPPLWLKCYISCFPTICDIFLTIVVDFLHEHIFLCAHT